MALTTPTQELMIFDAYLTRMERRRREDESIQNYAYHARRFTGWCSSAGLDPCRVTTDDLEDYFAEMLDEYSPGTMRNHLKSLRSAYRYAQRRGVVTSDPTVEVVIPQEADREPVVITEPELRAIKGACRDWDDLALFALLAYAGLRRVEIRRLRWEHLNFKTATLTVERGKMNKLRKVPIHPELATILRDGQFNLLAPVLPGRAGGQLSQGAMHYRLHRLGRPAHDFRRTVASSLFRNGVHTDTIDKIMGWSPRVVRTRYYQHHADADLQAAILRLYADDPV
jgi:integrase